MTPRNNESAPGARSCMISSQIQRHKLSTYCIKCNDHPCDNFVFPGDSTEKIYTDQQKVRDEPDITEDTAEILMPGRSFGKLSTSNVSVHDSENNICMSPNVLQFLNI
jgi:hypothetical protein